MKKPAHLFLWIFLGIAILLGIFWQFYPLSSAKERVAKLPLNGIHFRGTDIPLTPFEENFFHGINVLKRIYLIGNQKFFITILDGTANRHVVHDPYYCFTGGGWSVVEDIPFKLPNGTSSLITIKRENEVQNAMFWFSDEKEQYTSPLKYWMQTTLRRLTLGRSGAEPILIMIQPTDNEEVNWNRLFDNFPDITKI